MTELKRKGYENMIPYVSSKIANILAKYTSRQLDSDDIAILAYGMECILNITITTFIICIYSLYFHTVFISVTWMICFYTLRTLMGGFHASSHFKCIILSISTCILLTQLSAILNFHLIHNIFIFAFCILFVFHFAPVSSIKNNATSSEKENHCRIQLIMIITILFTLTLLPFKSSILTLTTLTVTLLAALELFRRKFFH